MRLAIVVSKRKTTILTAYDKQLKCCRKTHEINRKSRQTEDAGTSEKRDAPAVKKGKPTW